MKIAIFLLALSAISFLPLAISGRPPLIRLPTSPDIILDTDGHVVISGLFKYYAVPVLIGVEGGINAAYPNTGNPSACPTDVVINVTLARPITFYNIPPRSSHSDPYVRTEWPLNVAFDSPDELDPCAQENVWRLNQQAEIVTGGAIGKMDDLSNWFRIEKNLNGSGYLFNWWPSLCLFCKIPYYRIGLVGDGYQLGINYNDENLYAFQLVKAY